MDKKIKKYSWIHELNAAAMKAKLLNEAEKYAKQQKFLTEQQHQLNEAKEAGVEGLVNFLKDIGVTIPQTRRNAAAFRGWRGMMDRSPDEETAALGAGVRDVNPDNSDMDGDGEGSGLEVQADVESDGELDGDTTMDYERLGRMPTYNIPPQPVTTQYPEPTMAPGMRQDAYTRMGMQQAETQGIIPPGTLASGERKRAKDAAVEQVKAAATRAFGASKGKLPATRKAEAMKAGREAAADANARYALERMADQEDDRFRDEQMTIDNEIRKKMGR